MKDAFLAAVAGFSSVLLAGLVWATQVSAAPDVSQCRAINDPAARLQCYESLAPPEAQLPRTFGAPTGALPPQTIGNWRLVRTPNPRGGKEAISINRTGDLAGSDPDFVGLMIRCGESDVEVLLVMLRPLSFRARPQVSVNGAKFESIVAPPGLNILLPRDVTDLAIQRWPALPYLSLEIADGGTTTKGKVLLDGFDVAFNALNAACLLRQ